MMMTRTASPAPPGAAGELVAAFLGSGWTLSVLDEPGRARQQAGAAWYCLLVCIRGDLRAQAELTLRPAAGGPARQVIRHAEMAVRHPQHDPADFACLRPARWSEPATADPDRRCLVHATLSLTRLLARDEEATAAAILAYARQVPFRPPAGHC